MLGVVVQFFYITSVLYGVHSQMCNPVVCFHWFNALYDSKSYMEVCGKLKKLENCLNSCSFVLNEDSKKFFKQGMPHLKGALCENGLEVFAGTEEMSKCYNEYKFRFMYCFLESLNLKASSPTTANYLTCKRIFEAEGCPVTILKSCSSSAVTEASDLMIEFLKPVGQSACTNLSYHDVMHLKTYMNEDVKHHQRLAKCMDLNQKAISTCIPQKLTDNFLVSGNYQAEICDGAMSFARCVSEIIGARCDKQSADVFKELLSFLRMSLLLFCTDTKEMKNTVTSSPIISTTGHVVKSDHIALKQQAKPSDAGEGLPLKPSMMQPQNHSNHSVFEVGVYVIHINPKTKDQESATSALNNNSSVQIVMLLTLMILMVT